MEPILKIRNITKKFSNQSGEALKDISLDVFKGEMLALIGESGSGKTTLLRLIAGLESPTRGTIELNGRQVVGDNTFIPPEKRKIGMVFQEYALFPHMNVEQNINYGLHQMDKASARKRLFEVLEWVNMADLANRYSHELSGGQQQRAALARALAPSPSILLLDEPFSHLDGVLKDQMREELHTILKNSGTTALFVTHDTMDALSVSDRIALLQEGVLQQVGKPRDLYEKPTNLYTAGFLGKINHIRGYCTKTGILTDFGTFPVKRNFLEGEEVLITIRPEHIQLADKDRSELKGVLYHSSYQGDHLLVHLRPSVSKSRHSIILKLPASNKVKIGDVVGFKVNPDFTNVFPGK
nr:ABC transporter ATP-binding protein [Saprospiraceae bacterium]